MNLIIISLIEIMNNFYFGSKPISHENQIMRMKDM